MKEKIKNFLKKIRIKIRKRIFSLNYKLKNYIIFESSPDFQDNTRYIYEEMINREYNKKYKIFWLVHDLKKFKNIKIENVFFISNCGIKNMIRAQYVIYKAKCIIDSNLYIGKRNKNQIRIYTTHGMPIKFSPDYCNQMGKTDCIISTSSHFNSMYEDFYHVKKNQIAITGYARNDALFKSKEILYQQIERSKTILWMPTYRNHKDWVSNDSTTNIFFTYGVPCIESGEELRELNDVLIKEKILLIIKLHPAEDKSKMLSMSLSNIKILDINYFDDGHKTIYDYLGKVDALITDYSSIYYDFLLTKKQIALAVPDLEIFSTHMSIFPKNFKEEIVGDYIYNFKDLISFVKNVSNENDITYEKRMKVIKKYHKYIDGNSSKRVVDLIESEMNK